MMAKTPGLVFFFFFFCVKEKSFFILQKLPQAFRDFELISPLRTALPLTERIKKFCLAHSQYS